MPSPQTALDLRALEASLLRVRREFAKSESLLFSLEKDFSFYDISHNFHVLFEMGLTRYTQGRYQEALDHFSAASERAGNNFDKASALINLVLCLETLGISFQKNLTDVQDLLRQLPADQSQGLRGQVEALILRQQWRAGQFSKILTHKLDPNIMSQSQYFRLWIEALPYHPNSHQQKEFAETFAASHRTFFNKNFRLRTLLGYFQKEDSSNGNLGDLAARAYLWTWLWMTHPHTFPLQNLTQHLSESFLLERISQGSEEARRLFGLALSWLSLFDPMNAAPLQSFARKVSPKNEDPEGFFTFEKLIIQYFSSLLESDKKRSEELLQQVRLHSQAKNTDHSLLDLISDGKESARLDSLRESLKFLVPNKDTREHLSVDLIRFEVIDDKGQVLQSPPISLALYLIKSKETLTLDELMLECFGIPHFESHLHLPRMNNLLSRIKQIMGPGAVRVKQGLVYAHGNTWNKLKVQGHNALGADLRKNSEWRSFVNQIKKNQTVSDPNPQTMETSAQSLLRSLQIVKRRDLEVRLKISKSAAQKLINQWLTQGVLIKKGFGKRTIYQVKKIGAFP